jgi:hypothetical protein
VGGGVKTGEDTPSLLNIERYKLSSSMKDKEKTWTKRGVKLKEKYISKLYKN